MVAVRKGAGMADNVAAACCFLAVFSCCFARSLVVCAQSPGAPHPGPLQAHAVHDGWQLPPQRLPFAQAYKEQLGECLASLQLYLECLLPFER